MVNIGSPGNLEQDISENLYVISKPGRHVNTSRQGIETLKYGIKTFTSHLDNFIFNKARLLTFDGPNLTLMK